jgi:electron transport complex protein RnfC
MSGVRHGSAGNSVGGSPGKSVSSFRHGIHPTGNKELTEGRMIERVGYPDQVILPLSQHIGAPSRPVVAAGDRVFRGQLIAEAVGFVSVPLHASVTGRVAAIEKHHHPSGRLDESIIIDVDHQSPQTLYDEHPRPWQGLNSKQLLDEIQQGGFVGLGGAAFPTHVKLSIPEGKHARWLIINGCECEPYLTSDHRIMLEWADSIILGVRILAQILGTEKSYIGVETNKWDAIQALAERIPEDLDCELVPLETKYPQGAEKMLITAVLKREVPSGKLPIDVQVVVQNVGTAAGIGDLFAYSQPLIERVVTVTGPGVNRPTTLLAPVGMRLSDMLSHCGGLTDDAREILFGGPMMGTAQQFLDVPILKGTSGILCLTESQLANRREYPCIRCSACLDACPVYLNPSTLGAMARAGEYDAMLGYHIMDCMECGSCSYVCPSNIPLVQRFRVAKALLREEQAREEQAREEQAREEQASEQAADA